MHRLFSMILLFLLIVSYQCEAQELLLSSDQPRPTPRTRPELKRFLEQVKVRTPRIPLPPISELERDTLGAGIDNYEQRVRFNYLGSPMLRSRGSRALDPEMSLPYAFKTQIFWIVSRVNNCHYCIGHQETKLLAAGQVEDEIAALDCDWGQFPESHQLAFEFARNLTNSPAQISDSQFKELGKYFNEKQILEMVISIAWNNSINRWKEALAVPQNPEEGGYSRALRDLTSAEADAVKGKPSGSYLTPTSPAFAETSSSLFSSQQSDANESARLKTVRTRGYREYANPLDDVLAAARERKPRLPLATEGEARARFGNLIESYQHVPKWIRLMAVFPIEGVRRAQSILESRELDSLTPVQRARQSWVVARQDDAGYVLGLAQEELKRLGAWDKEQEYLETDWSHYTDDERILLELAADLAHSPVVLTDAKVDEAVRLAGPSAVVQTISHVIGQTALIRLSEAANLNIE